MKAMQIRGLIGTILANITVEPYIFLYSLGFGMTTIITPILYMDKICSVRIIIKIFILTIVSFEIKSLTGRKRDIW